MKTLVLYNFAFAHASYLLIDAIIFVIIVASDDVCIELFYYLFVTPCFLLLLRAGNCFKLFGLSGTRYHSFCFTAW